MVAKAVAVLLLVCCLALTSEAWGTQQCPHGQIPVGTCSAQTWWKCRLGQCIPVNGYFGICCKKFHHGGYY
uniref:Uncharacterized protein n=1 Tax=Magallana gigas TaxID=29159 RepID=A0A8W8MWD7_MAGGI